MSPERALITGASSGIGYHLAHEFAHHGLPLVLVAPVEAELKQVAQQLQTEHEVEVHIIARNLEREAAAQEIYDELLRKAIDIHILVNNAGHGFRGRSWEIPIHDDVSMVRLNIEAPLRLTKLFIKPMLQRERGRILNTASVAGFEPGPLLNVYHATKAFVLSWSEALSVELKGTGVTVTALCPGPTDTDFFPKAGMIDTRIFQKGSVAAPQDVAHAGYHGLMKEQLFVVPGGMNKALVAARRILSEGAQARLNMKFYEEVSVEDSQRRERGDLEKAAAEKR